MNEEVIKEEYKKYKNEDDGTKERLFKFREDYIEEVDSIVLHKDYCNDKPLNDNGEDYLKRIFKILIYLKYPDEVIFKILSDNRVYRKFGSMTFKKCYELCKDCKESY